MQGFCDKIGANCDEIVSWAGQGQDEVQAETRAVDVASGYDKVAKAQDTQRDNQVDKHGSRFERLKNRLKRRLSLRERLGSEAEVPSLTR